jgi:hypothetical protein
VLRPAVSPDAQTARPPAIRCSPRRGRVSGHGHMFPVRYTAAPASAAEAVPGASSQRRSSGPCTAAGTDHRLALPPGLSPPGVEAN